MQFWKTVEMHFASAAMVCCGMGLVATGGMHREIP